MRLKERDIDAIKVAAREVFGDTAVVRLFGSRVDDERRGGDIDLLIEADANGEAEWSRIGTFRDVLFRRIDEQKVDVVLVERGKAMSAFARLVSPPVGLDRVKTEELIRTAVERCDRIVAGFDDLRPLLAPVLPATGDDIARLPLMERIASVALLKRYEQLQDMLGRLFRAYLAWEVEDVRAMTRRDQANQLEKFGIFGDADDWIGAAELRNRLVHEYPIDEAEQVDRVNDTWSASAGLVEAYALLRGRLVERGLLS